MNTNIKSEIAWDITDLRKHLIYALQLEFWTIPFYISAFWSIPATTPDNKPITPDNLSQNFQHLTPQGKLILSAAIEEMFHFQTACNLANAFNTLDNINQEDFLPLPKYGEKDDQGKYKFPHINFNLRDDNPTKKTIEYKGNRYDFTDYTSTLGPADQQHINAMCLIEFPYWEFEEPVELYKDTTDYSSIGHFYTAVLYGMTQNVFHLKSSYRQKIQGINQKEFGTTEQTSDFKNMDTTTITGRYGWQYHQAFELIQVITKQGEGNSESNDNIPNRFQNQGIYQYQSNLSHFEKFLQLYQKPPQNPKTPEKDIYTTITDKNSGELNNFIKTKLVPIFTTGDTTTDVDSSPPAMTNLSKQIYCCYYPDYCNQ